MNQGKPANAKLTRRHLLLGTAGAAGVAATSGAWFAFGSDETRPGRVLASSEPVRRAEQARRNQGTGRTVRATLNAETADVDLGGRVVRTWAYGGTMPGNPVRCTAGDLLEVDLVNRLPEPTTVHWHGLRLRNDMDGVPQLTQQPVPAGERLRYSFVAPDPGTYWLHPHVGLQRERGLFAPLIIDDPRDSGDYDVEFVVVLDDWIDDVGKIPDHSQAWQYHVPNALANPPKGIKPVPAKTRLASSVEFPFYLLNGRLPTAPETFHAKPGQRARIRLINAAGATVFRVALGGHRMTVTHTDGFPVEPVTVDTLQVASGERYDLDVTLQDGVFPLVGVAEGKAAQALGVVRTGSGPAPPADAEPEGLSRRLLALGDLRATPQVREEKRAPEVRHTLYLTGDMNSFGWRINAQTYDAAHPFRGITPMPLYQGQHVQLELINQTPMYHPMHLHGHTFTVRSIGTSDGRDETTLPAGTRKGTLMIAPSERILVDFTADNPGQWLIHCHNAYHLATGMATVLSYRNRS